MSASVVEIEKPVVIDRKQNLREHRLYWVGRRTPDAGCGLIGTGACGAVAGDAGNSYCYRGR